MREEPEVYVPLEKRRPPRDWPLVVLRLWCVLGVIVAWFVLIDGTKELHFRAALFTLFGFYAVWQVVSWIFRPAMPDDKD